MPRSHASLGCAGSAARFVIGAGADSGAFRFQVFRIGDAGCIILPMRVDDFLSIRWSEPEGPLIEPPRFSPVVADPSFLFPSETSGIDPDSGSWQLFAHSAWGIHRYASSDGTDWTDAGLVVRHAMRPFLRRADLTDGRPRYLLYYESYPPFALPLTALPFGTPWKSVIALRESRNLADWSRARIILRPDLPWMADPELGQSVSNPCLAFGVQDLRSPFRLYFSASLSRIEDCGFNEPRFVGCATGNAPEGPFSSHTTPMIDPAEDSMPGVLGAGSLKAIALEDGWIGLQNKIYRDPAGKSRSAIFTLRSEDGLTWRPAGAKPLLAPSAGWMSSHVYACDCRQNPQDGLWYLYFNARDGWRISEGRERIGRIVGSPR